MNAANPAVDASAQTGRYDPAALEQRWQESWKADGVDSTEESSEKPGFFALSMFPYLADDPLLKSKSNSASFNEEIKGIV